MTERDADIDSIYDSLERLRRAQRRRRNAQTQAERSGINLPPLALSLMAELHRVGPMRVQVLAERADAELPRVSRELRNLVDSGHVTVTLDRNDKRARIVKPTRYGTRQWTAYQQAGHTMLHEILEPWKQQEVADFAGFLRRFLERGT